MNEEPAPVASSPSSRLVRVVAWIKGGHANLFLLVGVPGALGGFLTMLLGNNLSAAPGYNNWFSQLLISLILGAIAGFVVVVVLTNTDRKDYPRLFTLAFIAGLAYRPILDKGLVSIGLSIEETGGVLSAQGDSFDIIQVILERASTLDEKTPQEDLENVLDGIRELGVSLQSQLIQLEDDSGNRYLAFLVPQLQEKLPVELETQVFEQLRSAGLRIDELIDSDQPDFFQSTALSAIPDRLIVGPESTEPPDGALSIYDEEAYKFGNIGRPEHWLAIDIDYYAEYVINVYSDDNDADLVGALYRASDMVLVNTSDDSGDSLNPELVQSLDIGRYYLQVTSWDGADITSSTALLFDRADRIPSGLVSTEQLDERDVSFTVGEPRVFAPPGGTLPYLIAFDVAEDDVGEGAEAQIYVLEITGSGDNLDLMAGIYESGSRRQLVTYDDDSAGNFNPRLSAQLLPGTYVLRVTSYDSASQATQFTVTRMQPQ